MVLCAVKHCMVVALVSISWDLVSRRFWTSYSAISLTPLAALNEPWRQTTPKRPSPPHPAHYPHKHTAPIKTPLKMQLRRPELQLTRPLVLSASFLPRTDPTPTYTRTDADTNSSQPSLRITNKHLTPHNLRAPTRPTYPLLLPYP